MADVTHKMYCAEQSFSTGTWSGSVLTGFTMACGHCDDVFVVQDTVIERGASIYNVKSVRDLTCPYCGTKAHTEPDQDYILKDTSRWGFED